MVIYHNIAIRIAIIIWYSTAISLINFYAIMISTCVIFSTICIIVYIVIVIVIIRVENMLSSLNALFVTYIYTYNVTITLHFVHIINRILLQYFIIFNR